MRPMLAWPLRWDAYSRARQKTARHLRLRPSSTARETAATRHGHSTGEVRDLAWTRRFAGGFPSVARDASLLRDDIAAGALWFA
jgi:hypothetical protein